MLRRGLFFLSIILVSIAFASPDSTTVATDTTAPQITEDAIVLVPEVEMTEDVFTILNASAKPEAMELEWSLDYNAIPNLFDKVIIIKYITDIDAKRIDKGMEGYDWTYLDETIDINAHSYTIENLVGNEKYVFKIGIADKSNPADHDNVVWSSKIKEKTQRAWGIMKFLILLGSLGLFIYGMKVMSEGMQQSSGSQLRNMLGSITSNRVKGVFTGFASTALVQSSSVTTVMTVSLVNAGLLTLRQSAGVMMGANIGTTITAWLVLLLGFKVSISSYALVIIAIGAPLLFMTFRKAKGVANVMIGFAILFIGLQFLKDSVPDLDKDSGLVQFFVNFKDAWYGPVMFVFLGAIVTIVVQSSSAAMALTLAMVDKGLIPYDVACAMVLGENIGTTVTAEIASLIGNVHAKRSARIHSMFNIVGVTWMLLIYTLFTKGIANVIEGDPYTNSGAAATGIALFHTTFNAANVVLLIWFVPQLVSLAEKTVRSRGLADEEFKLDFIGGPIAPNADLSILEAKRELAKFGKLTGKMSEFVQTILFEDVERKKKTKLYSKIKKYEEITDRVEVEVNSYLEKVSQREMSEEAAVRVRGMLRISTNLERIGDIFYQMSKTIERKEEEKVWFNPDQRNELKKMFELIDKSLDIMGQNLDAHYGGVSMQSAIDIERKINKCRDELRKSHIQNIGQEDYNLDSGMYFVDLFASLEKIGDHVINVSEGVTGKY